MFSRPDDSFTWDIVRQGYDSIFVVPDQIIGALEATGTTNPLRTTDQVDGDDQELTEPVVDGTKEVQSDTLKDELQDKVEEKDPTPNPAKDGSTLTAAQLPIASSTSNDAMEDLIDTRVARKFKGPNHQYGDRWIVYTGTITSFKPVENGDDPDDIPLWHVVYDEDLEDSEDWDREEVEAGIETYEKHQTKLEKIRRQQAALDTGPVPSNKLNSPAPRRSLRLQERPPRSMCVPAVLHEEKVPSTLPPRIIRYKRRSNGWYDVEEVAESDLSILDKKERKLRLLTNALTNCDTLKG